MKSILGLAALSACLTFTAFANDNPAYHSHIDELLAKAQIVKAEAAGLAVDLKSKQADLEKAADRAKTLDEHAAGLTEILGRLEASATSLTSMQKQELERLKTIVGIINAFTDAKLEMFNSPDASRQRNILRAKAEGIAKRIEFAQQSANKLKG